MKNLILASTVLSIGLLQGCIVSSGDDDGGDGGGGGSVHFFVDCPAGAASFSVTGLDGPEEVEDCAVGEIVVLVDPGTYDVTITVFDDAGEPFRHVGAVETVVVADGDDIEVDFVLSAAQMGLTWTFDGFEPEQADCDALDASGVTSFATIADTSEAFEDVFDCAAGQGVTDPMPLADYVVVVELLNSADESIATSQTRTVSLLDDGVLVDLENFNFVTN